MSLFPFGTVRRYTRGCFRPALLLLALQVFLPLSLLAQSPDLARLDALIAQVQRDWPVPGLAVAIVDDGETVFANGYGVREVGGTDPVDENTLFAIASNTKAFTSASVAMLVEEGSLGWDDPVREHLPYFQLYDPYVSDAITVRDLLCHRSGLGTFSGDLLWFGTHYSAEEVVRRIRHLPATGPFRASYGYSNLMFITAGEVIAGASGMSFPEFIRERILDPLGMDRTVLSTSELPSMENVATPHKNRTDGVFPMDWVPWEASAAAGGIISSVSDMSEWLKVQLRNGEMDGGRLFSETSSWEMWTVHTPLAVSAGARRDTPSTHLRGYGLGWSLYDFEGRLVVTHSGGYDGMFSRVILVPEEELGIVVLTNSMTGVGTAIANIIRDAYLGAEERDWSGTMLPSYQSGRERFEARQTRFEEERIPGTSPSLPLEGYAGTYGGPLYGDATVSMEDGGLVLRLLPNPEMVADLTHLHHDTFLVEWRNTFAWFATGAVSFQLDVLAQVTEMTMDIPNDDFWFYELEMIRKRN